MKLAKSTFKGVELVKVGDWKAGTGRAKITREHLAAVVDAYADAEVDRPPIKLGHTGGLALGDSLPAAGWVVNPRLSADGNSLIGDLSDVPTKLAEIIPTAYKRRSVEMDLNVTTPSGKTYPAALTGLALLGAQAPAVKGLEDVLRIYASELEAGAESTMDVLIEESDTPALPHDENGGHESKTVTDSLGKETKVAKLSPEQIADLRKKYKLDDSATVEEIFAAHIAAGEKETNDGKTDEQKAAEAKAAEEAKAKEAADAKAAEEAEAAEKIAASAEDKDTVRVSKVMFSEMQNRLGTLEKTETERRHDEIIRQCLSSGRITPAEEKSWRDRLVKSEPVTKEIMLSLAPRFNTVELGDDRVPNLDSTDDIDAAAKRWAAELGIN